MNASDSEAQPTPDRTDAGPAGLRHDLDAADPQPDAPTMQRDGSGRFRVDGDLVVTGSVQVLGAKQGYLADQFVNVAGDLLEEGDVVVIGDNPVSLFYGQHGNIPVPEVDLTETVLDRRVCGVVAQAELGAAGGGDRCCVAAGQRGLMVTMGAFAHCKVDADLGAIEVGDLLSTSSTRGHAQKVTDPGSATGAIIGKALAPLRSGRGKIAVMVMLH